ncbi:hypothetical protein [Sinomonas halotolerans]|uniref:Uncharacterized protein n=1 Tax=Sinomonas halotolerans TaxID=1644133 RepID=A0ABU9WY83_9MICC
MTQTASSTDTAPREDLPDSLGFGFAEIAALLRISGGPQAEASAKVLHLERELADARCVSAGASSLVARGLATADADGGLSVAGAVAATAQTLGSAVRWIQIDLVTPDSTDNVFSIEGSDYAILAQPRAHFSWFVMARNPGLTGAQADFAVVKAHLDAHAQAGASLLNHQDPGHRLLVKRAGDAYTVGLLPAGAERAEEEGPLDEAAVTAHIERFRAA